MLGGHNAVVAVEEVLIPEGDAALDPGVGRGGRADAVSSYAGFPYQHHLVSPWRHHTDGHVQYIWLMKHYVG